MENTSPIINKVAESGLITVDLADFFPSENSLVEFDLKKFLFKELILKEKDFRESLKTINWDFFLNKNIFIHCTVDAVIPSWAYMLVASYLSSYANEYVFGTKNELNNYLTLQQIEKLPLEKYTNQRIVIKGCGDVPIDNLLFVAITKKLMPIAKSIMYGEPCSTVPIYKRKD